MTTGNPAQACRCFGCSYQRLGAEVGDDAAEATMARELGVDRGKSLRVIAANVRETLHGVSA
jgi:hypothetical protein